jgi:ketosteroid isomerase-like protein
MKTLKLTIRLTASAALFLMICADRVVVAAQPGARTAIAAQSKAFMDGMSRADAIAVAQVFTSDAKIMVSGVEGVIGGREAIQSFWQSAINGGVKELRLTTLDLDDEGPLRLETGTYQVLGKEGGELGSGRYLFAWKMEAGAWKIHRDVGIANPAPSGGRATADRVGFPRDYRTALKLLSVAEKHDEPSITTTYGNELAASITSAGQLPYPYGTVIAMEFSHGVRDGEGQLMHDTTGAPLKAEVAHVDVMRRERGYGAAYGDSRAGEWEFASYRPDGSTLLSPENSAACAACHLKAGAERDFVFRVRVPPK